MSDYAREMEPDWKVKPGHERLKGFTDVWIGMMGKIQRRCDACGASFAVGSAHDAHRFSHDSVAFRPEIE